MGVIELIERSDEARLRCLNNGREIVEFLGSIFPMSETEGDRLIGYMEGHGYLLAHKDGALYRGDLCYRADEHIPSMMRSRPSGNGSTSF